MLKTGDQVIYVELYDGEGEKRYILPNNPTIVKALNNLLLKFPNVNLSHSGVAFVKAPPSTAELDSIPEMTAIPAAVDALVAISMPDHPELPNSFGRYSKQLIDLINQKSEVESVSSSESLAEDFRSQLKERQESLTAKLKQQVSQNAQLANSKNLAALPSAPQTPSVSAPLESSPQSLNEEEMDFEAYIQEYVENLHDLVLEVLSITKKTNAKVEALSMASSNPSTITGEVLRTWFTDVAAKVGFDQAFEILAQRIKGENPEV